jgi:hypothetical protein
MLCTNCNRSVRPVIALDIDGTLANYHEHFFQFATEYYGRTFRKGYDGSITIANWMGISKEEYRQCKLAYRLGGMKRCIPPYLRPPHTTNLVDSLRRREVEIWFTTTRPYLKLDTTDPDTREWLRRQDLTYEGLIYDDNKYETLLDIVGPNRIIGIVDDDPEQYDRAEQLELFPIQIARQHNLSCRRPVLAATLAVALKMLIYRYDRWRAKYGFDPHGDHPELVNANWS